MHLVDFIIEPVQPGSDLTRFKEYLGPAAADQNHYGVCRHM